MAELSSNKDRGCDVMILTTVAGVSGVVEEKLAEFVCSDKNWVSVLRQRILDSNA